MGLTLRQAGGQQKKKIEIFCFKPYKKGVLKGGKRDGSSTTKVKERGKRITMMRLRRNQQIRRKLRVTPRRGTDQ